MTRKELENAAKSAGIFLKMGGAPDCKRRYKVMLVDEPFDARAR